MFIYIRKDIQIQFISENPFSFWNILERVIETSHFFRNFFSFILLLNKLFVGLFFPNDLLLYSVLFSVIFHEFCCYHYVCRVYFRIFRMIKKIIRCIRFKIFGCFFHEFWYIFMYSVFPLMFFVFSLICMFVCFVSFHMFLSSLTP